VTGDALSSQRARWIAALSTFTAWMLFVLRPIWTVSVEPVWDGMADNYPMFAYAADRLRAGELPLWNPYSNCGEPFISEPQRAWYQPAAVVAALVRASPLDGFMLFWTLVWIWAGLGAFALAAVLGVDAFGCLIAAMTYALSGFFVGHAEHLSWFVTASWFPWALAAAHRAVERQSLRHALLAGAALGLSALAGYPGLVIYGVLALGMWLVLAFLVPWSGPAVDSAVSARTRAIWVVAVVAISAALLLLIWSPVLYAFAVEAREFTDRTKPVDARLALYGHPFSLRAAVSFLFPRLTLDHEDFFPADVSMNDVYIGALGVPLAVAWLADQGRRAWWLAAPAILWAWLALGADAGLRTLVYDLIPPTRYLRYNAMVLLFVVLPLAMAAGAGAGAVIQRSDALPRVRAIAWGWLGVMLAVLAWASVHFGADVSLARAAGHPLFAAATGAVLVSVPAVRRRPGLMAALLLLVFAVDLTSHLQTNFTRVWTRFNRLHDLEAKRGAPEPGKSRINDLETPRLKGTNLQVIERVPVVEGYVTLASAFNSALVRSRYATVLMNQRFWLSPTSITAPGAEVGLPRLAAVGNADPVPVFVEGPGDAVPGSAVVPGSFGEVRVNSYRPERVELEAVVPGSGQAVLASTERASRSWRVTVDGMPRPIERVNYFFRGVRLGPGAHQIVFEFDPAPFRWLLGLSYGTLVVVLLAAGWLGRRRGRLASAGA